MKIAFIGNMNNNNFAMMRYFRDLGVDAHLLLFANDGQGRLSHFKPENDTWELEKWQPFIHQTRLINGEFSIVGRKESHILLFRPVAILKSFIKKILGRADNGWKAPTQKELEQNIAGYDKYIGSGISPAIFERINRKLDMFYPYSFGIEFFWSTGFHMKLRSWDPTLRLSSRHVRTLQASGLKKTKHIVNSELSHTANAFKSLNINFHTLTVPMVYVEDNLVSKVNNNYILQILDEMSRLDFSVFSSTRLLWNKPRKYTDKEWIFESKNNQWLINGFSELVKARPKISMKLYLLEYGPDIQETKNLCENLGINEYVRWLPKMGRRELMAIQSKASVVSGQFYEVSKIIWAGTGWEALAGGKPLLQGFNFEQDEFEKIYGYPPPPMLPVRKPGDVVNHLINMTDNPQLCEEIGRNACRWFHQYNGMGLAKKWLDLLLTT